jgi:hypothetical protein
MSSSKKLVALPCPELEPELRVFIDEVLLPMLVRDALNDMSAENQLAPPLSVVRKSPRSQDDE